MAVLSFLGMLCGIIWNIVSFVCLNKSSTSPMPVNALIVVYSQINYLKFLAREIVFLVHSPAPGFFIQPCGMDFSSGKASVCAFGISSFADVSCRKSFEKS